LLGDSKNSNTTTSSERNDTHDDDESVSESDHTGSVDMSLFKSEDSILGWVVNVGEAVSRNRNRGTNVGLVEVVFIVSFLQDEG
jgi:hypothetical protein